MPKGKVLPTSFLPPGLWSGGTVTMAALTIVIVAKHPYLVRWFRDKISLGIAGVRCLGNVMSTSFIPPGLWPGGMVTMAAQATKICVSGGIHPFAHIINCSGAPSTRAKESTRDSTEDPGGRNLSPLPLRLGTRVAATLGPLCRSTPLHHATLPLVLHHRYRVAGLPP